MTDEKTDTNGDVDSTSALADEEHPAHLDEEDMETGELFRPGEGSSDLDAATKPEIRIEGADGPDVDPSSTAPTASGQPFSSAPSAPPPSNEPIRPPVALATHDNEDIDYTAPYEPAPGSMVDHVVADRFRVQALLGVGGMGAVYRATQLKLEREVALKILKKDLRADPETITRFHREARAMSLLKHPNTVRVFDFGETDDERFFIAMELLKGELLSKATMAAEPKGVGRAVRIARQILGSLAEAHTQGVIHRDLKPDNIFLAEIPGEHESMVKVLDFGIAKVFATDKVLDQLETQAGTVFGTPRYMSPEQAQGKTLDPRSDLYTVGVLLYQMLTGSPPFIDRDAVIVMAKHIRELPVPVRQAAGERPIPASLEKVVMRALEKKPSKRFQTAEEFIAALDEVLPEVDETTRNYVRANSPPSGLPRIGRKATPWLLAVAAAAAALVGVFAMGESAKPAPDTPPSAVPVPAVAEAKQTQVDLSSIPAGADIVGAGGEFLGVTPGQVWIEGESRDVKLVLSGYETEVLTLSAASPSLSVSLVPVKGEDAKPDVAPDKPAAKIESWQGTSMQGKGHGKQSGSDARKPPVRKPRKGAKPTPPRRPKKKSTPPKDDYELL